MADVERCEERVGVRWVRRDVVEVERRGGAGGKEERVGGMEGKRCHGGLEAR